MGENYKIVSANFYFKQSGLSILPLFYVIFRRFCYLEGVRDTPIHPNVTFCVLFSFVFSSVSPIIYYLSPYKCSLIFYSTLYLF